MAKKQEPTQTTAVTVRRASREVLPPEDGDTSKPVAVNPKALQKEANAVFERNLELNGRAKLDARLEAVFLQMARRGRPVPWICDMLGVPQRRFFKWVGWAEEYFDDPDHNKDLRRFWVFLVKLRRAVKEYLAEVLDQHRKGYGGEWVKFAWLLERLEPKIFGRKDLNLQGPVDDAPNADAERFL
jgi:hypothetical protein